ncbi:MAG: 30S ribosomal protein S20 [Planctomycetota bacterium]
MAHSKQARKRIRQNETRRLRNKGRSSEMRTLMKRLQEAVAKGDKATAVAMLPTVCKKIDKAAKTHVIHKNTASRKKSLVARLVAGVA